MRLQYVTNHAKFIYFLLFPFGFLFISFGLTLSVISISCKHQVLVDDYRKKNLLSFRLMFGSQKV